MNSLRITARGVVMVWLMEANEKGEWASLREIWNERDPVMADEFGLNLPAMLEHLGYMVDNQLIERRVDADGLYEYHEDPPKVEEL